MKYRLSFLAVAVVVLETATASNRGGGAAGGGQNWYLRTPDGSSQGPYALPQLGDWWSAGYVSPGKLYSVICDDETMRHECVAVDYI